MARLVTAVFLIALLVAALWFSQMVFVVVACAFVLLAWREFAWLAASAGATPLRGLGPPLAVACAAAFAVPRPGTPSLVLGISAIVIAAASLGAGRRNPGLAIRRAAATVGGCVWLGLLPGFHIGLRYRADGVEWLIFLYAAVAAGDIAAYYGGRLLGRRALAPSLSPKKTVEGTVCGLVASALAAGYVANYWIPDTGLSTAVGYGLVLGAVGQLGDLLESALKRAADTKDSSGVLPGHGGVLDRIDGMLFGGVALYALLTWVGH